MQVAASSRGGRYRTKTRSPRGELQAVLLRVPHVRHVASAYSATLTCNQIAPRSLRMHTS
jgi:hypothetical protein